MKKAFLFAAMLAIAASCTVQEIESVKGTTAPEITASYENNGTKTTITTDEEGVGTIWWKPADEINVFYGNLSTHYVSKNTENATTVAFGTTDIIGSTESASENIWGLYPYNENAVCDGESVTTTIPATQQAIAGTFDDDIFTSLAHSTSTVMTFYNVLGGIKFSLSRDDIQTITFKGNNDEDIAGKVKLEMDANGKPVAEITEGEKTITLTPKEGTTFASGTNYYIVMLPTILSNGFTMTFETETEIGTFEYTTKSIEIKRSVFSKKENIDTYATFVDKPDPEYVDLGLSVMWATCNIGASNPEDYGGYYQWAGLEDVTSTDINLSWSNCPYHTGSSNKTGWTKYIPIKSTSYWSEEGNPDNKLILDPDDDIAHVTLGDKWRMPTKAEYDELIKYCTRKRTLLNGVSGIMFTSKINGNSIFLPEAGSRNGTNLSTGGADYWLISLSSAIYADCAIATGSTSYTSTSYRYNGMPVRPVYGDRKAANLSLDEILLSLSPSHSVQLTATLTPNNSAEKGIIWNSTDASVATVSETGFVTALSSGSTLITVSWVGDSNVKAACKVIVIDSEAKMVDLGLSSKWATCNIGASSPEESGDYYAWGEIETYYESGYAQESPQNHWKEGKEQGYWWPSYKWCNGQYNSMTKYCNDSSYGYVDNKTTLDLEDDVAFVTLGEEWHIPSVEDFKELQDNCIIEVVKLNGINVVMITSNINGECIFIPFKEWSNYSCLVDYWTSNLYNDEPNRAHYFRVNYSQQYGISVATTVGDNRCSGKYIRPVYGRTIHVSSVGVSETSLNITEAASHRLSCTVLPLNAANKSVQWTSSNPSIVSIEDGFIVGVKEGSATITVETIDGGLTSSCAVTVMKASPEYVDLGLSVKWATFNVGATKPEEVGSYYAWGETEPKTNYEWSTYKWCNGTDPTYSSGVVTKYCTNSSMGNVDGKTTLDSEDDVAQVKWGGNWRIPTREEYLELENNTTQEWTSLNGKDVLKVTSNINGNTIFFPAASFMDGESLFGAPLKEYSDYWASTLDTTTWHQDGERSNCGDVFFLNPDLSPYGWAGSNRRVGLPVRPVVE